MFKWNQVRVKVDGMTYEKGVDIQNHITSSQDLASLVARSPSPARTPLPLWAHLKTNVSVQTLPR
jgi:hypothetical protein